jgi:hypothetical protein
MNPPWGTLVVSTEIWMAGPGGRVVVAGGRVAAVIATVFAGTGFVAVEGTGVSFPVGGGPVVAGIAVVTTVAWVVNGAVSTVVAVVAGAGVVTAWGRVMMTMVGVWGAEEELSFRRWG